MNKAEGFGECLQRVLTLQGMSASEAARLVGFRSRNSIFRILSGSTSWSVDAKFLASLREAVGDRWPQDSWDQLTDALNRKRLGDVRFRNDQAFAAALFKPEEQKEYIVESSWLGDGQVREISLRDLLRRLCDEAERLQVVMCGCCERSLMTLLASCTASMEDRVYIRHYIDIHEQTAVANLLAVLPMVSKVWYNARLVQEGHCPPEMEPLYQMHTISVTQMLPDGGKLFHQLLRCDSNRFVHMYVARTDGTLVEVLDRCRFRMEALKPIARPDGGPDAFTDYTRQCLQLEEGGMILSIKPDLHFNLVPTAMLYQSMMEGFEQTGLATGPELHALLEQLREIHDARNQRIRSKRRPTRLVYSLPAMEQFMRTGVQTDHFFIQRAYTPEERRSLIRQMMELMQEDPLFSVHFLRPELPEVRNEMTLYEGKGVLLMDAYTSYDLHDDHSEALISLPVFMKSFQEFFFEEVLEHRVLSRAETFAALEWLMQIP